MPGIPTYAKPHKLLGWIADPRNPLFIPHSVANILRVRMLAVACGYEGADDLGHLRGYSGSSLPAAGSPIRAAISVRNRRCRVGLERRRHQGARSA